MHYPDDIPRGPVCGIACVAILAEVSFTKAVAAFEMSRDETYHEDGGQKPRAFGHGWGGRSTREEVEKALNHLGWVSVYVRSERRKNGRRISHGTLARLDREVQVAGPRAPLLVQIGGHFLVLREGLVFDQTYAATPLSHTRGMGRSRVFTAAWIAPYEAGGEWA